MRFSLRFALLAVVVAAAPTFAQKGPPPIPPPPKDDLPGKNDPVLKIGDPAPPLTINKWHQGPEVKAFEKDKVYVVVFWEAFRGESSGILRAINALHAKHKDIIPVAVGSGAEETGPGRDGYSIKREAEFVANAKPKFAFAFANDKGGATKKAYGTSGEIGVYVVGKDGKIAFVAPKAADFNGPGLTDLLPDVLPKVLDGSWKGQKDADAIAETEKEFQKAMNYVAKMREQGPDFFKQDVAKQREVTSKVATESLKGVDDFLKTHPSFAGQSRTLSYRALMAAMSGQKDVAAKAVDAVIADGNARGTTKEMIEVAKGLGMAHAEGQLNPDAGADKLVGTIIDVILKAPVESVDANDLFYMATTSIFVGMPDKGRAIIEKMFASAPKDIPADKLAEQKKMTLQQFEEQVKQIEAQLKERKKK